MIKFLFILITAIFMSGCANFGYKLKSFLRGEEAPAQANKPQAENFEKKFSEIPSYLKGPQRQYKRVTKSTLESEAQLEDSSGSLWVMEGQGAYLFAQNIMRMIGDPIGIKIDGEPKEQLESKVKIITDLINRLASKRIEAARKIAAAQTNDKNKKDTPENKNNEKTKPNDANASGNKEIENKDELEANFPVKTVPTRIVERLVDGNYRIKGSQPFMIGKREYNVIVTGIVRAEDFAEDGISSTQLLDPKFDIVSKKRRETTL
jgi:flagellar L-ring protein precursor FlgH